MKKKKRKLSPEFYQSGLGVVMLPAVLTVYSVIGYILFQLFKLTKYIIMELL